MEDHLHVFDDLERIFINNDPIDVLASLLSPNMNMEELDIILKKLQNNQNNEESNPKYKKIHSLHMQTSIKKEKNDVLRSETRTFVFMNSEKKFDEEDEKDRLNIRGKLEDYYIRHSDGPLPLITKLIKVFKEMNFFSSSLQSQYQELIKLKNQRGKDLEFYNSHLHEFLDKNHKSEEDIKIITNEEELNGYGIIDQEDFNLPALQIKPNSNITTVNVIKNYVNSRSKTDDLIAQNKELISFFIKLYSTLIFITKRLCKTIGLIGEISKEIPNILLEHTQSVLKKLDINFHSPIILARKGSETLKSSSKNVFNFSEIVENDNKMDTIWSLSTPKTLKNLLVERNESEKQIELTNLKFLEKKTNVRKFISELFDNESEESLNCLHKFIKEVCFSFIFNKNIKKKKVFKKIKDKFI